MAVITLAGVSACGAKKPPVARATPPPPGSTAGSRPPAPPEPVVESEPVPVPPEPSIDSSDNSNRSLDEINKQSPLQPVFYELDSAEMSAEAQATLAANAEVLKKNPTWVISIEGHCDERGTAEYNLALGERRALSARSYLVSLGLVAGSACGRSATARSSRSIRITTKRPGPRTAAPISS